jgi:hypothetical protein
MMNGRVGSALRSIVALGVAALAAFFAAHAAEPRQVHIDVGSTSAPLIATVHVEDYRKASIDLLAPAATGDSPMTRLMKTYYEVFRTGDTKRVASLFEPHMRADANDHYPRPETLTEQVDDLRSARMLAVLHWGEYQFSFAEYERTVETGGTHQWSASHAARCVGDTCHITHHLANSQLGRMVAAAFSNKGGVCSSHCRRRAKHRCRFCRRWMGRLRNQLRLTRSFCTSIAPPSRRHWR